MTLLKKLRLVAAKHESTIGTAESLAAADAAMNVFNPVFQPSVAMHDRENPSGFGSLAATPGQQSGTATFMTEVHGDGSGGVPFWASRLLPACGMVLSGTTFSPKTGPPVGGAGSAAVRTLTLGSYENGRLKLITGAMGSWRLVLQSRKHAVIEWTFVGRYESVTDAAMLSGVTRPTQAPIPFAASAPSVGGSAIGCVNEITIDSGNNVIVRPCSDEVTGVKSGLVTGRKITATLDPEAQLIATSDVYGAWLDGTEQAFSLAIENGSDLVTFAGPKFQRTNIQDADRDGIDIDQTTAQFNIDQGDDEFTISFGPDPTPETP